MAGEQSGSMGKEDRKQLVLDVLRDSGYALPPAVVFRNVKLRGATFERRATDNYLEELVEEGQLLKVDPAALESREIIEVDTGQEGYFILPRVADEYR